jgi:hypothetical protein
MAKKTDANLFDLKKALVLGGIAVAVIVIPLVLISGPMFDVYQGWIDKNRKESEFARWLQFHMGKVAGLTLRPERAHQCFERYLDYWWESEPPDPRLEEAHFLYAYYLAEDHKRDKALAELENFFAAWGEDESDPFVERAIRLRDRLLFVSTN